MRLQGSRIHQATLFLRRVEGLGAYFEVLRFPGLFLGIFSHDGGGDFDLVSR